MICHTTKCIFIHIPRTGGSSIEKWILGRDQWDICPEEKHLTAIQAKTIYKDYWDQYFKFSFIRNPYTRCLSLIKYDDIYGVHLAKNTLLIDEYKKLFGFPITIEHDYRFYTKEQATDNDFRYVSNSVYQNILTQKIDKIFLYENMKESLQELSDRLKIKLKNFPHEEKSKKSLKHLLKYKENIDSINELYDQDFIKFNYTKI